MSKVNINLVIICVTVLIVTFVLYWSNSSDLRVAKQYCEVETKNKIERLDARYKKCSTRYVECDLMNKASWDTCRLFVDLEDPKDSNFNYCSYERVNVSKEEHELKMINKAETNYIECLTAIK